MRCLGFSLVVSAEDSNDKECRVLVQPRSDGADLSNELAVAEGKPRGARALMRLDVHRPAPYTRHTAPHTRHTALRPTSARVMSRI